MFCDESGNAFDSKSLVELREVLGLNQTVMARELGVPTNTLSRWETGSTTPDANTLTAVYSVASDHGVDPRFFRRVVTVPGNGRPTTRLAVVWDLATAGVAPELIGDVWSAMASYLGRRFPHVSGEMRLMALDSHDDSAARPLGALGFRVPRLRSPGRSGGDTPTSDLATVVRRVARFGPDTALVLASATFEAEIADEAERAGGPRSTCGRPAPIAPWPTVPRWAA